MHAVVTGRRGFGYVCDAGTFCRRLVQDQRWKKCGRSMEDGTRHTAPRAEVAVSIRPGLDYVVANVHNEWEEASNGIVQALAIDLPNAVRLTRTYVSPNISTGTFTNFLTQTGSGRNWIIGYLNARDSYLDITGNARGRAIR